MRDYCDIYLCIVHRMRREMKRVSNTEGKREREKEKKRGGFESRGGGLRSCGLTQAHSWAGTQLE